MGVGGDWGSGPCGFVLLYVEYARDLPVPHRSTEYCGLSWQNETHYAVPFQRSGNKSMHAIFGLYLV